MNEFVGIVIYLVGVITIAAWFTMPFAVIGIDSKLKRIISILEKTK